jgi:hypothetical protein
MFFLLHAQAMESANSSAHIGTRDPAATRKFPDNMTKSLKENVERLELKHRETQPIWWKEWETQSKSYNDL